MNPKSLSSVVWVDRSLDFGTPSDLFSTFLTDNNILETMMSEGEPWEDYHHRSCCTLRDNPLTVIRNQCLRHLYDYFTNIYVFVLLTLKYL